MVGGLESFPCYSYSSEEDTHSWNKKLIEVVPKLCLLHFFSLSRSFDDLLDESGFLEGGSINFI